MTKLYIGAYKTSLRNQVKKLAFKGMNFNVHIGQACRIAQYCPGRFLPAQQCSRFIN